MNVEKFLELRIAPRAVFEWLAERAELPRFMVREGSGWRPVTWASFANQIRAVALFLSAGRLTEGGRAAIFAHNRVEWMSAALAIQAAGGVLVPIYPASTAAQAAYIVSHSDAEVVFVDAEEQLAAVLASWSAYEAVRHVVLLDDGIDVAAALERVAGSRPSPGEIEKRVVRWSRACAIGASLHDNDPDAFMARMAAVGLDRPGLMLYTSGTTGDPKGVPLTHENVAVNGRDWLECNAPLLEEGAVDLLWLPMSHIFGFGEACLGNTLGFCTYLSDPQHVIDALPTVRPNVFMSVPALWEKLAKRALAEATPEARREALSRATGGRLSFCLSGGAGLAREVKEVFHEAGVLLIEGYGLTECSPTLTLNRASAFRFDAVGKPLPSVEIKLAEDGEILARGPNVFRGYHKDPRATEGAFTDDGWFKTGDVGRFTEDGFLQIVDRKKEILVTAGGKNIPPANIERRFAGEPLLSHVIVYGDGKKYLTAGVWLAPEAPADVTARVEAAVARVNAEVARFERIQRWRIMETPLTVESGLLTATLKIRRKRIYEAFRGEFESLYTET